MTEPRWFRDEESFGIYNETGDVIARNFYRDVEQVDGSKHRVFPSIHVRPDHRHQGLAGRLTKHSLDITIDEGYRVVPVCPYVARWMSEYDDGAYLKYRAERGTEDFHAD